MHARRPSRAHKKKVIIGTESISNARSIASQRDCRQFILHLDSHRQFRGHLIKSEIFQSAAGRSFCSRAPRVRSIKFIWCRQRVCECPRGFTLLEESRRIGVTGIARRTINDERRAPIRRNHGNRGALEALASERL